LLRSLDAGTKGPRHPPARIKRELRDAQPAVGADLHLEISNGWRSQSELAQRGDWIVGGQEVREIFRAS
jgi:hypothetical protein